MPIVTNVNNSELDKMIKQLNSTYKQVMLIVDPDPDHAQVMADMFNRRGYQVFIEYSLANAKSRIQVLDFNKQLVDVAIIDSKIGGKEVVSFTKILNAKYKKIKTIVLQDMDEKDIDANAALFVEQMGIASLPKLIEEANDWPPKSLIDRFNTLRSEWRKKRDHCVDKRKKPIYNQDELNLYMEMRMAAAKRLAPMLLELFRTTDRRLKHQAWLKVKASAEHFKLPMDWKKLREVTRFYDGYSKAQDKASFLLDHRNGLSESDGFMTSIEKELGLSSGTLVVNGIKKKVA
jgi:CheY-like chemotaxis protein